MAVAAFAVFEMMTLEQEVDIFYTAKQVMEARPEAFSSEVIDSMWLVRNVRHCWVILFLVLNLLLHVFFKFPFCICFSSQCA